MSLKAIFELLKTAAAEWNEDQAPNMAAALSYYTLFSVAPLLLILITLAGLVLGRDAVQQEVLARIGYTVGTDAANLVGTMIQSVSKPAASIPATILGIIALVGGALGVFGQIKGSLNKIWDVSPKASQGFVKDIQNTLQAELSAFLLILLIGALMLVSFILSAVFAALADVVNNGLGSPAAAAVGEVVNFALTFVGVTLSFMGLYRILPDTHIAWTSVSIGAVITALLFMLGKFLIGLYLSHSGIASAYGAAGSLVVLLLWVNYSAQIFYFGAEITQVYAKQHHLKETPAQNTQSP
jgi:membrane protein